MNPVYFGGETSSNISVLGIECLFEGFFGVSESFRFSLIRLYIGREIIEFFLNRLSFTSTLDNRFLSDILTPVI
jgi:hypothetical protein